MTDRQRLLAWVMALPAIVAAAALITLEAWRSRAPESPLFSTPFAYSLAEAVERDDVSRAYEFIRAGQDPNTPIEVRHAVLTGGRPLALLPLLWAVANDSGQSVRMLLGYGARFDPATQRAAMCLAATLMRERMLELLRHFGAGDPAPPCPAVDERDGRVAAFAAGSP
ncbi:MAG: hypothetical protein FJW14_03185 [Acidimicrobiia bacterium]|nr:hypothetical protein [Acidimicrobiia bacterium]